MDNDDGVVVTQNICYQNRAVLMIVLDFGWSRAYYCIAYCRYIYFVNQPYVIFRRSSVLNFSLDCV